MLRKDVIRGELCSLPRCGGVAERDHTPPPHPGAYLISHANQWSVYTTSAPLQQQTNNEAIWSSLETADGLTALEQVR